MPKAELHVHLEGTLEAEHLFKLAQRNKVRLEHKNPDECIAAYDFHDLASFLKIYYAAMNVLRTEEDFYELAYHYFERAAKENIIYVEPFFDPQAHTTRGIEFSTIINGIHQAQVDAKNKLNLHSNLIMCFLRDMSAESALSHLEMAKPYQNWIVGVGLDSNEKDNPPIKFLDVFSKARSMGWKLTMHCDVNQQDSISHIRECLDDIQVDRIDHGINALEDDDVCNKIINRRLGLTACPVSNEFVVQDSCYKEIRVMLEKDMLVTVNSDDPAYFRAYLNDNFLRLCKEGSFTKDEILKLAQNSFEIAWISDIQKQDYLNQLNTYRQKNSILCKEI